MINTIEREYKCAYKEVSMIIEYLDDDIRNKIPNEKVEFYRKYMDNEHSFEIDFEKDLFEQNILYPTRCILANLFRDYIATEEDRAEILKEEQEELNQIEKEKREKYNPNDIFKNEIKPKVEVSQIQVEEISTELMVQDENISLFDKIKNKIKEFIMKLKKKND